MKRTLFVTGLLAGLSCKREPPPPEPLIEGQVFDNFGRPVAGATVSLRGTAFETRSDPQGRFRLRFAPGTFRLGINAPGYLPFTREYQVTQAMRFPVGAQQVLRLPTEPRETVVVVGEAEYLPVNAVELQSRVRVFGPYFPNRCAAFTLERHVPTFRGKDLAVLFPDDQVFLVRVQGDIVTTDRFGYTVGVCPNPPAEVAGVLHRPLGNRTVFLAESLPSGLHCFLVGPRTDPTAPSATRAWCFLWQADPSIPRGARLVSTAEEQVIENQLGAPEVDPHAAEVLSGE